uniref:CDP-diacylglycerol--glycerol-3-phosphate 3-phosphatidyltransferase n=1 Tax=Fibrocapsa japonica TaxID=94617 RepID=A0A7S2UZN3_9STRA
MANARVLLSAKFSINLPILWTVLAIFWTISVSRANSFSAPTITRKTCFDQERLSFSKDFKSTEAILMRGGVKKGSSDGSKANMIAPGDGAGDLASEKYSKKDATETTPLSETEDETEDETEIEEKSSKSAVKANVQIDNLWNIPNILTMLRVVAIPIFAFVFYLPVPWRNKATAAIFAVASATDWLDGYLARKWKITSPFGAFLDPVADKLMVASALVLLAGSEGGWVVAVPAAIILAREITVSALREWMAGRGERSKVQVGMAGKVKTACQMVSLILLLLAQKGADCPLPVSLLHPAALALLYLSTVLTVTSGWGYLQAAWPALSGKET